MARFHAKAEGNVPFTAEEEAEWDAMQAKIIKNAPILKANEIRAERNRLIAECDWTQVEDSPVDKAAWATYRQELRDLTLQAGFPFDVTYPTKP